jgi:hypothetical protein
MATYANTLSMPISFTNSTNNKIFLTYEDDAELAYFQQTNQSRNTFSLNLSVPISDLINLFNRIKRNIKFEVEVLPLIKQQINSNQSLFTSIFNNANTIDLNYTFRETFANRLTIDMSIPKIDNIMTHLFSNSNSFRQFVTGSLDNIRFNKTQDDNYEMLVLIDFLQNSSTNNSITLPDSRFDATLNNIIPQLRCSGFFSFACNIVNVPSRALDAFANFSVRGLNDLVSSELQKGGKLMRCVMILKIPFNSSFEFGNSEVSIGLKCVLNAFSINKDLRNPAYPLLNKTVGLLNRKVNEMFEQWGKEQIEKTLANEIVTQIKNAIQQLDDIKKQNLILSINNSL